MRKFLHGFWTITTTVIAFTAAADVLAKGGFVDADELGATFDGSTHVIDNPWWPLPEDLRQVSAAATEDGCTIGVIDVLPWVDGFGKEVYSPRVDKLVDVREVLDREFTTEDECDEVDWEAIDDDFLDGLDLLEITFDWYAQDDQGRIWYFGEFSISLEEEDIDDCGQPLAILMGEEGCPDGSWEAGVPDDETVEGIIMLRNDELAKGEFYFQEYWEDEATDMAKILNFKDIESFLDVPSTGCLMTKEWVPLEPGNGEHKYYCYGTGLVLVEGNAGGKTEWTDLVFDSRLD